MNISIPTVDSLSIHNKENLPEIQDDTSGTKYNNEQLPVPSTVILRADSYLLKLMRYRERLKEILVSKSTASLENSIHRFDKSSKLYLKDPYSINSKVMNWF